MTNKVEQGEHSDGQDVSQGVQERGSRVTFYIGLVIVILALLSGLTTYLILTGLTPIAPTHDVVVRVLLINLAMVIAMLGAVAWQVFELWRSRRRQSAGARLHVRIVGLFSVIAVLPAILLAVFASVSLDRGLDHWFSERTRSIIGNSLDVANAYLDEHGQVIRSDVFAMAQDIDAVADRRGKEPDKFKKYLAAVAALRAMPAAYLINSKGEIIQPADEKMRAVFLKPPSKAFELARGNRVVVITPGRSNITRVAAVKKLNSSPDTYLYALRPVNPKVINHLRQAQAGVSEFIILQQNRKGVQIAFGLMYTAIALTLLLAAIWVGLWFANRLVSPIRQLIGAAKRVSQGDLTAQVEVTNASDDLGQLGNTFNNMTTELRNQHGELMDANGQLDERRRFMEAVLSGVTAGVVGIDTDGRVTLINPSAQAMLGLSADTVTGQSLHAAVPEFAPLLDSARADARPLHQEHINILRDGSERNYAVRVTTEQDAAGYVLTFDDVTELVTAQRTSAWADVARRIAHEIKNPLTPIQLSAERIRRKYGKTIEQDRDVFEQCTDTIIRQVGDIGRMVDEFSSFARMPKPTIEPHEIGEVVREAVFLFQMSHPQIEFAFSKPEEAVMTLCDRRLISQAVTNLVKNASEAIEARAEQEGADFKGKIEVTVARQDGRFSIEVVDNGCGLPKENRSRLVEPYMTTRTKGTGLGLAIVKKIIEQHSGTIALRDAPLRADGEEGGAAIRLEFPIRTVSDQQSLEEGATQPVNGSDPAGERLQRGTNEKQGVAHGV